jgi:hypothetical protein
VFAVYLNGAEVGTIEPVGLPTPGFHDNWPTEITEPLRGLVRVETVINGKLVDVFERACGSSVVTTTTGPPPTLPVTGPVEDLGLIALIGVGLLTTGLVTTASVRNRNVPDG